MPTLTLGTISPENYQRLAVALGKAWNLKDADEKPRPATAAELKLYGIQHYKRLIHDIEGRDLQAAALASAVVPDVEIT